MPKFLLSLAVVLLIFIPLLYAFALFNEAVRGMFP
jgi:hypothetical protein